MAQIIKRVWRAGPKTGQARAWGCTMQVNGKQVRKFNSEWATADDAEKALASAVLKLTPAKPDSPCAIASRSPPSTGDGRGRQHTALDQLRRLHHSCRVGNLALARAPTVGPAGPRGILVTERLAQCAGCASQRSAGLSPAIHVPEQSGGLAGSAAAALT